MLYFLPWHSLSKLGSAHLACRNDCICCHGKHGSLLCNIYSHVFVPKQHLLLWHNSSKPGLAHLAYLNSTSLFRDVTHDFSAICTMSVVATAIDTVLSPSIKYFLIPDISKLPFKQAKILNNYHTTKRIDENVCSHAPFLVMA